MSRSSGHAAIEFVSGEFIERFKINLHKENDLRLLAFVAVDGVKQDVAVLRYLMAVFIVSASKPLERVLAKLVQVGKRGVFETPEANDSNVFFSESLAQ